MNIRNNFKKGMAAVMSAAIVLGMMPGMVGNVTQVKAAGGDKTIAGLGTGVISNPTVPTASTDAWQGSYVYFGTYGGNPVKYRVLDNNTSVFGGTTMLLDCDSILELHVFGNSNVWADSNIRTYLNETILTNCFTSIEQNAIASSTKSDIDSTDGAGTNDLSYVSLNNDKIFLLDAKEVTNTSYGYSDVESGAENRKKTGGNDYWWLRSAEPHNTRYAGFVNEDGSILDYNVYDNNIGVSPAFNINLSSVLFSSVISGTAGSTGSEYKLTLLDNDMTVAVNGTVARNGDTVTVPYTITGANSGNATQVSILITDKAYTDSNAQILHYGALDTSAGNGTGTFTLSANLSDKVCGSDYYAYIIAEDVNGEKETDYASTPVSITVPASIISSVAITDINAPTANTTLDTSASCTTTGVSSTTPQVTWIPSASTAGYNTSYAASVTLTAAAGYEFTDSTTATVNGNTATSVTKNADGTLTVTYTFPATAKDKLTSITASQAIRVANGTAYASMNLPTEVNIETVGRTATTASVSWNTTTPASGSYDQTVLTEQTVTLNGTVTCPDTIDANGVALTTTITITIEAAGITGAPTANPAAGTYTQNQSVTLTSSTEGATIYYTTDGSEPTLTGGVPGGTTQEYTAPIAVTGTEGQSVTTAIKAIAVKSGMQDSSGETFTYTIQLPVSKYDILDGANSSWTQNSDVSLSIRGSGAFSKFVGVKVDGTLVDAKNYSVKEGSTIVTLKTDYLNTLSVGMHTFEILWTDGSASTTFTVVENTSDSDKDNDDTAQTTDAGKDDVPKTGDDTPVAWLFTLFILSGTGLIVTVKKRRVNPDSSKR